MEVHIFLYEQFRQFLQPYSDNSKQTYKLRQFVHKEDLRILSYQENQHAQFHEIWRTECGKYNQWLLKVSFGDHEVMVVSFSLLSLKYILNFLW